MKTIDKIFKYIMDNQSANGTEIANHLAITRQAVNKHLKVLVENGDIRKTGNTKAAVYFLPDEDSDKSRTVSFKRLYEIRRLNEDSVFQEINNYLNLMKNLRQNVFEVIQYAFTEILNNAIDHSESDRCLVHVQLNYYDIHILIRDYGIGIYYSIYKKFGLNDEYEAVGELLKGKTTTMSEKHSGEGIFFTSKALDTSVFRSHKMKLIFDTKNNDVLIEDKKYITGTEAGLRISRNSRRNLAYVFDQFAPEEFEYSFQRTKVHIRLYLQNLVSRSEARRLLTGLHKFKEIILDFKDVRKIGQGFADEIFRVFKNRYPEIEIKTENISPLVEQMIKHVVDNNINN
jgi:anti-sigma regulatory factor (Ser/Thr protein kinase)